ncbi:MAG TPA: DUF4012 domain-containing protein [Acidimicrobiales bacterium]|nr:DUF4012 domain-containing protein [Acidimicrobiales bacterium]
MTTTSSRSVPGDPSRRRRGPARHEALAARAFAAAAAVGGALAGCHPTGTDVVDVLLSAAAAVVVTLAAARSTRWAVLTPAVAAVAFSGGWALVPALASGATAFAGARRSRRSRLWGAATGALAVQALLRLPDVGFHGATALVAALAVTPVLVSGYRKSRRHERRAIRRVALALVVLVGVVGGAYCALVLSLAGGLDRATGDARAGLSATRRGETDAAQASFARAASAFERADSSLGAWWAAPARAVPVLGQHARALSSAAAEGHQLSVTAGATAGAVDYDRLRSTDGRFDLGRIRSVQAPLARTIGSLDGARRSLADDDSGWLVAPVADGLDDLDGELAQAQREAALADEAVQVAPGLLGGDGPRRYLVAFVTPAELRGSGGFMGSWAEITTDGGELRLTDSGPFTDLVPIDGAAPPTITGPEEYLARYGRFAPERYVGDVTFSPHFPYDAQVMREIYPQTGRGELDGVISIDPIALAALLTFTGPVEVEGFDRVLTSDNAAEFLLRDNYALFPDGQQQNEALSRLVETTFDQLTTGDLPGPRQLADVLAPPTQQGRIRLWSPRGPEQALFARLGATGAFPEARPDHDFLALSSQNTSNNKIDVFQSRTVDYDVDVASDGGVRATARITVRNDAPLDGSVPAYVIGNTRGDPPGTNLMLLSVHTPHGLVRATLDGRPVGMESQVEAGFPVYSRLVSVPPGGAVTLELELRGALDVAGGYVLDLAPHPTTNPDQVTVRATVGDGKRVVRHIDQGDGRRRLALPSGA